MMRMLLSRWVTTLVGTALLAGVVWEFGPLLPLLEAVVPRVLAIQTMLLLWAVANALVEWRKLSRDKALSTGLVSAAPGQEAAGIDETLAKALKLLKGSGQRGTLAELPWYAIIGPPGAGKTTALLNAGLTFTLAEQLGQAAIAGVGGTRMCEWWFTRDAVLIDTAGRYTTQDSDAAVDRAGWDAFLALLKRTRPRQPLNGVIVAIGLSDVAQASPAERDAHAGAIARRIAELEQRFGVRMPVYALFTKADLIAGFTEFFDDLDHDQRDQVLGETFALEGKDQGSPAERFASGFRALVGRLNERLLSRLQAEHRLDRRGAIAGFPTQIASLEKPLAGFIGLAFSASTMLRGVYFASGTQEGTPIDRLTGAMSRAFGIDQARAAALRPEKGRSYFLGRLLRDVIFGEAMLVREAPAAVRRRGGLRLAGFAVLLLAVLGTGAAMVVNDRVGEGEVDNVAAALAGYEQLAQTVAVDPVADGDLRPLAALLDQARALANGISGADAGFGMGQADKLRAGARGVYRDGLAYGLLPRLVWQLETQIRGSLARPDALYEATRIYLMLGGIGPLNAEQVRDWMARDWGQAYAGPEDTALRASLLGHLDVLLAEPLPAIGLDGTLVERARASFSRVKLADRVYAGIRASPKALALPAWRPVDVLGLAGVQVFARASGKPMTDGVPGFFTAAGFRDVLLPSVGAAARQVASETWVIGRKEVYAPAELQDLQAAVNTLYATEFMQRWDAMLGDLNIGPVISLPQAAQSLYILASPESPLRAVLKSVAAQVGLAPASPVSQHYRPLIDLMTGDGAALERSLRLVADIQQQLAKIAALPVGAVLPAGGDDIGAALLTDAARQPQPVGRWLNAVAASAQALRTGNVRRQIVLAYNAPGGPAQACQAAVTNRYPFAAGGTMLPLDEFARVFGPAGVIDGFLNTQLKPFVDMSAKTWKPLVAEGTVALVSAGDVAQFQRAANIRDAFFATGQPAASVQLEIAPAGKDARAITLDLAGTSIEMGGGLVHAAQVTWPAQDPGAPASLSIGASPTTVESGPWAMFRLFARGRLQPSAKPGQSTLTFPGDGVPVSYQVRVGGLGNPFAPGLLSDFRCPSLQ